MIDMIGRGWLSSSIFIIWWKPSWDMMDYIGMAYDGLLEIHIMGWWLMIWWVSNFWGFTGSGIFMDMGSCTLVFQLMAALMGKMMITHESVGYTPFLVKSIWWLFFFFSLTHVRMAQIHWSCRNWMVLLYQILRLNPPTPPIKILKVDQRFAVSSSSELKNNRSWHWHTHTHKNKNKHNRCLISLVIDAYLALY